MTGMLLSRPFFFRFPDQQFSRRATNKLFQPRRSAPQARAKVRMLVHRQCELKFSFKPERRSIHEVPLTMYKRNDAKENRGDSVIPGTRASVFSSIRLAYRLGIDSVGSFIVFFQQEHS